MEPYFWDDGADGFVFLDEYTQIAYHWSLAGPEGIEIIFRKDPTHTAEDLKLAGAVLRQARDVVRVLHRAAQDWPEHWVYRERSHR